MKKLYKGKYYWHHDDSIKRVHPTYVYKKNDKKNEYNIIRFTSSKGKGRTKLNKNINPNSNDDCYVLNNSRVSKRKKFGNELEGYKITDSKDKSTIKKIMKKRSKLVPNEGTFLSLTSLLAVYTKKQKKSNKKKGKIKMKEKIIFLSLSIFMVLGIALCTTLAIKKIMKKRSKLVPIEGTFRVLLLC